eukprot:CAMPEP_0178543738 /NCGR_PEP_ID=MMETSP0697-20121206/2745_1 /TAXON_ID=265572 /ORGANISM="Extubocellulus spinifer, Strain CCMP396" /LENGTH=300 /DNA_ID=CAMNT_0020176211 /DNA_START=54 /DNA_END=956 /DNA_ORIENTATION=+
MAGYIDTSDINIAEVREYWRCLVDRSAAARVTTCSNDSATRSADAADASVDGDSTESTIFAPTTCADTSSTVSSLSFLNASLFDGYNGDEPMLLMAVSSDDSATCTTPPSAPPPFKVDLSPIVDISKKKSTENPKPRGSCMADSSPVQEWPDLATTNYMDKISMLRTCATRHGRVHVNNVQSKYKEMKSARSASTRPTSTCDTPLLATNTRSDINATPDQDKLEEFENHTPLREQWGKEKEDASVQQRTSKQRVAFGEWPHPQNGTASTFSYPRLYHRLERRIGNARGTCIQSRGAIAEI